MSKHDFGANISKVLSLMIHSLYKNKEIFLRELISNAHDACDKYRFFKAQNTEESQSDSEDDDGPKITITTNKEDNIFTVTDNGIGMDDKELIDNLGTIANSGTEKFMQAMQASKSDSGNNGENNLIGQFGVGFYSGFMVADKIEVYSCKAGTNKVWKWVSSGDNGFEVFEAKDYDMKRGTAVVLYLKDSEDRFLDKFHIRHVVETHSNYIPIPIMLEEGTQKVEKDEDEKGDEDVKVTDAIEQLNEGEALWNKRTSDISDEQYKTFFQQVAHVGGDPWMILHNHSEGAVNFTNCLCIPSIQPFNLAHPDRKTYIKLCTKNVLITEESTVIPQYMRFLRGVVSSSDFPLNICRESLQNTKMIAEIRDIIVKKVLNALAKRAEKEKESYESVVLEKFWPDIKRRTV